MIWPVEESRGHNSHWYELHLLAALQVRVHAHMIENSKLPSPLANWNNLASLPGIYKFYSSKHSIYILNRDERNKNTHYTCNLAMNNVLGGYPYNFLFSIRYLGTLV